MFIFPSNWISATVKLSSSLILISEVPFWKTLLASRLKSLLNSLTLYDGSIFCSDFYWFIIFKIFIFIFGLLFLNLSVCELSFISPIVNVLSWSFVIIEPWRVNKNSFLNNLIFCSLILSSLSPELALIIEDISSSNFSIIGIFSYIFLVFFFTLLILFRFFSSI